MGINPVDRQMYLTGSYLQDQLKWPPRVRNGIVALALPPPFDIKHAHYIVWETLGDFYLSAAKFS